MQITTIGLDIAKNVFQVHGIDAAEKVVVRKQLRRGQVIAFFAALLPCLIGMEACATAHYWARELTKLGHEVWLMPAKDVKAYVKRNKNDAADAEAICEAVRRPTTRFVRAKSAEQQGRLMQHRARDLLLRQRTQTINALRAHLAELGIAAAQGREGLKQLLTIIADEADERVPIDARASLIVLAAQLQALQTMIGSIEKRTRSLLAWHISGFPIDGLDRFASTSSSPLAVHETHGRNLILPSVGLFSRSRESWRPIGSSPGQQRPGDACHLVGKRNGHDLETVSHQRLRHPLQFMKLTDATSNTACAPTTSRRRR
jgi:transposase